MSQKHPPRLHGAAAKKRRVKNAAIKVAKKERRVELRKALDAEKK
jgi:hypothetical protein